MSNQVSQDQRAAIESLIGAPKFYLTPLTVEQVRNHPEREYNPREWDRKIDRFVGYGAQFYGREDRLYVVYMAEGIRFFAEFGYISALSSNGFVPVWIDVAGGFRVHDHLRIDNTPHNRPAMRQLSALGDIFTNEW